MWRLFSVTRRNYYTELKLSAHKVVAIHIKFYFILRPNENVGDVGRLHLQTRKVLFSELVLKVYQASRTTNREFRLHEICVYTHMSIDNQYV